jgi:hypothetical protein
VFGDRTNGAYLHRFAWTNIVRHQMVNTRRPPATPRLPTTESGDDAKGPYRSTTPHCGSRSPGRTLRDPPGNAARRRGPATNPTPMGNMADHHPDDNRRPLAARHLGHG